MKVATGRWGEVTIKKQGIIKNKFDATKSFSIMNTKYEYDLEQLYEIYTTITDLSEKYDYHELKKVLLRLGSAYGKKKRG